MVFLTDRATMMAKTLRLLRCGIAVESIISIRSILIVALTLMLDRSILTKPRSSYLSICTTVDRLARESLSQRPKS